MTATALVATPGIAVGHTPNATLTCDAGLVVNLTQYNGGATSRGATNGAATNTVTITIDGSPVLNSPFSFGGSFSQSFQVDPPTARHDADVVVRAWDDPSGEQGWSRTFNLSIDACQEPTPPPATPTPPPATPTGVVAAEIATPSVTLPPTDSLSGSTSSPSRDSWRLMLLALAGALATTLLLTTTHSVVRRKDR